MGEGATSLLRQELGLEVEAWESESRTGEHVIDVLKKMLSTCGFAVLVAVAEDSTMTGISRQTKCHP